ncbi:hypothetical protein LAZ67_23000833 [Cordylochernes scorpioides]|uniref:Reverse transcriptase Ty1/copia-type domain-containing protein n=1 Tax=Cordylochernes scorpioides TaxID=51811 RepID=A0ABY6LQ86_9ARAC|nr:hypothetical protein LAZ67_23000833 [Cordylochernes scorpioides]
MLLSHATNKNWEVNQMDIPTAFLNGNIESDIYIKAPQGVNQENGKIFKLNKALYELRESPNSYNNKFNEIASKYNFTRSLNDSCLYINDDNTWIVLYIDDLLITGKRGNIDKVIEIFKQEFNAKDLGKVTNFLGMEISRESGKLMIKQSSLTKF